MFKILLVDDDSAFLEIFYQMVAWADYGFEIAARLYNGAAALEYLEAGHRVDAIITDIRMPECSGTELAEEVYRKFPDVKVVFFSAFCDFSYASEAIKYDVVGYISKPVSYAQVEEVLYKLKEKLEVSKPNSDEGIIDSNIIQLRKTILSDWFNGRQVQNDVFLEQLEKINISYRALNCECAIALIELVDINKKVKLNKNFYDVASKVLCTDTTSHYSAIIHFAESRLVILYISKRNGYNLAKCINTAVINLRELFELGVEVILSEQFETLYDLKTAMNANDGLKAIKTLIDSEFDLKLIDVAKAYVNKHYAEEIAIETVAQVCNFNSEHFSRLFKKETGEKFVDYLNRVRIEKAKDLLVESDVSVDKLYMELGYKSRGYFYKMFKNYTGEAPTKYRKRKSGERK